MTWNSNSLTEIYVLELEFWSTKPLMLNLLIKTLETVCNIFCMSRTCWILTLVVYECVIFYDTPGVSVLVRQEGNKYWNSSILTGHGWWGGLMLQDSNCNTIADPPPGGAGPPTDFYWGYAPYWQSPPSQPASSMHVSNRLFTGYM